MPQSFLREEPAKVSGKDNLFLWTVSLLALAAVVFACWLGSFYVFGHPEHPQAYRLLKKLNKLAPPVRFPVTKGPPGEFLEAQRIFERYSKYSPLQLRRENEQLFRNYLKNYSETKKLVPYLTGKFVVLRAYELQRTDLFKRGVVVLTQSVDFPQFLAEVVYPLREGQGVAEVLSVLQPGLEVKLQRTHDLSAILQVAHALDGRMQVTVVPLLYSAYGIKNEAGVFELDPPDSLNVGAGFPLVRGEEVRSVLREAARRRAALAKAGKPAEPLRELVRVDDVSPGMLEGLSKSNRSVARASAPSEASIAAVAPSASVLPAPAGDAGLSSAVIERGADFPVNASSIASPSSASSEGLVASSNAPPSEKTAANAETPKSPGTNTKIPPGKTPKSEASLGAAVASALSPTLPPLTPAASSSQTGQGSKAAPSGTGQAAPTKPAPAVSAGSPPPPSVAQSPAVAATKPVKNALGTPGTSPVPAAGIGKPGEQGAKLVAAKPDSRVTAIPPAPAGQAVEKPSVPAVAVASSSNVAPLKPFVPAAPGAAGGRVPGEVLKAQAAKGARGRSVTTEQASSLSGRNDSAPLYLHGRFVVTATGANKAVLRQSSGSDGAGKARVIVEYPAGGVPPQQGSLIAREDGRGFEIREVRRSQDGQVNIFVREVGATP